MGKNGGKHQDTILTLEEALKRFARKRVENAEAKAAPAQASASISKAHYADLSPLVKREEDVGIGREHPPGDAAVDAPAARDAAKASSESVADIVAVIDGVPCTLEDLERLAAADKAFREDSNNGSGAMRGLGRRHRDASDPDLAGLGGIRRDQVGFNGQEILTGRRTLLSRPIKTLFRAR